jgi:hypothetical protein
MLVNIDSSNCQQQSTNKALLSSHLQRYQQVSNIQCTIHRNFDSILGASKPNNLLQTNRLSPLPYQMLYDTHEILCQQMEHYAFPATPE